MNPYRQLLGARFDELAESLQQHLHGGTARGAFTVTVGSGFWRRLIARCARLPRPGRDLPVTVHVTTTVNHQAWDRTIGASTLRSTQWAAHGRLCERVGIMRFAFDLELIDEALAFKQARVTCAGIPLPLTFAPRVHGLVRGIDARTWTVDVRLELGALGELARYGGLMHMDGEPA